MTPEALSQALAIPLLRAKLWAPPLSVSMPAYGIITPTDQAMFLAQIGHESGGLRWTRELWGPTPTQSRYDSRADLGNTDPQAIRWAAKYGQNPGKFYRGVGLIHLTGFANICEWSAHRFNDLRAARDPSIIAVPEHAADSAGWFWSRKNLSELSAPGTREAFLLVTRRVNGGLNGLADREAIWTRAKTVLA